MIRIVIYLILGVVFLFGGLKLSFYTHHIFQEARDSESWLSTQASVSSFDIVLLKGSGGSASERIDIQISYYYQVHGNQYNSERISMAASDSLKELPKRPKIGDKITIYYDPSKPENATWIKGVPKRIFGLMSVGYLLVGIGLWLIFLVVHLSRKLKSPKTPTQTASIS